MLLNKFWELELVILVLSPFLCISFIWDLLQKKFGITTIRNYVMDGIYTGCLLWLCSIDIANFWHFISFYFGSGVYCYLNMLELERVFYYLDVYYSPNPQNVFNGIEVICYFVFIFWFTFTVIYYLNCINCSFISTQTF